MTRTPDFIKAAMAFTFTVFFVGHAPALAAVQLSAFGLAGTANDNGSTSYQSTGLSTGTNEISGVAGVSSARVQTGLGTNKLDITGSPEGGNRNFATSVWAEHFKVDPLATGPVTLSVKVRIDGTTSSLFAEPNQPDETEFNYFLRAFRGPAGTLVGKAGDYDDMLFSQQFVGPTGIVNKERHLEIDGPNGTEIGFNGAVFQISVPFDSPFGVGVRVGAQAGDFTYYADRLVFRSTFDGSTTTTLYSNFPSLATTYRNLLNNVAFIASTTLCGNLGSSCGLISIPDGQDLLLNFTLNPGEEFNIVGALMVENLVDGSINFFNTAQLTQITSTAKLTSDSGILNLPGAGMLTRTAGGFSFTSSAVPEPATWAMMIAGFGLVGGAMRRGARNGVRALA